MCYLVCQNIIMESMLSNIKNAINCFHHYYEIFKTTGIIFTLLLLHQHTIKHYPELIWLFGAQNRLYSSITKNKHITTVKKPYHQSNKYKALGQMLIINQHLDKLLATQTDFNHHGMLNGTCLSNTLRLIGVQSDSQL